MLLRAPATIKLRNRKIWYHGDAPLFDAPLNALFCSKACPGEKILEAMDLAQRWRAEKRTVISGFHTPVEKECLRIFLRGPQRIIVCLARGLDPVQLPIEWQPKFERNEFLIVSPFDSSVRRPTKETCEIRNRLVLDLATDYTIIHASPNGLLSKLQVAIRDAAL